MGKWRQCNLDHQPPVFWKNFEYQYAGEVFSVDYAGRGEFFEGLSVWKEEKYCKLQGTYPVIFLSFAKVKETSYDSAKKKHMLDYY